jgi:hypothetical protein
MRPGITITPQGAVNPGLFILFQTSGSSDIRSARVAEKSNWVREKEKEMADENARTSGAAAAEDQGIAGTGFKTSEELAQAYLGVKDQYGNLEKKLGEQGNELGYLRTQAETLANTLKENLTKSQPQQKAQGVDYAAEIATVEKEINGLDPMADGYQKTLSALIQKSNRLTAAEQHEKTLSAAGNMFKEELSARDIKAAQSAFQQQYPTFNTPDMQARIKDFISQDRTGMHDSLSAFFGIQAADEAAKASEVAKENAEMKRLLELSKGKDDAGKVIVKGQSPGQQQTKQPKVTGKDLDAGMAAALAAARGA